MACKKKYLWIVKINGASYETVVVVPFLRASYQSFNTWYKFIVREEQMNLLKEPQNKFLMGNVLRSFCPKNQMTTTRIINVIKRDLESCIEFEKTLAIA